MTNSTTNSKVEEIRNRVRNSYAELNQLIDGPLAALDQHKLYQAPPDEEWTIMQNLAHTVEFMPYWAGEIEKLVAQPGQIFGRTMQHEGRVYFISEHERDSLEQIRALLPASYTRLQRALGQLTDSDLTLTGRHPKFGDRDLDWFIEEFVTRHLANHVEQISACIAAVQ